MSQHVRAVVCVKNDDECVIKVIGPFADYLTAKEWIESQDFPSRRLFAFAMPLEARP